jgi:hypothetical protein
VPNETTPTSFFDEHIESTELNDQVFIDENLDEDDDGFIEEPEDTEETETTRVLSEDGRSAMIFLMRHGVVMARKNGKIFDEIVRCQQGIRAVFAEQRLRLVIDEQDGLAMITDVSNEAGEGDGESSGLIGTRTLKLYDTLLLIVLRGIYRDRSFAGDERIEATSSEIEAAMNPFLAITNSERAEGRVLNSALKRMRDRKILYQGRQSDDAYEISPVIRYVADTNYMQKLLAEYIELAEQATPADETANNE